MTRKKPYLVLSIALVLMLCVAQIIGSSILILPCLAAFLALVGWCCSDNFTLPILLFFLPWSPILKPSPDGFSFFTFALVLVCAISVVKKRFRFRRYPIVAGIVLLFLSLVSKLISGYTISFDYIAFLMLIVFFPVVKGEWTVKKYDFFQIVSFFALGVILAALGALIFAVFPNILRYIRVDSYLTITRRSGFYGDANFYTAHITAAIGGCLMLSLQERRKKRVAIICALLLLLLYCGFLSASKSFVLVLVCMVMLWVIALLRMRGRSTMKLSLLIVAAVFALIVASSAIFTELIDITFTRFSYASDLNSFTTGRVDLWEMYLEEILNDAKLFFLGQGFTNIKVNGRASHNTMLQAFFQFGLLGIPFLCYWMVSFFRGGVRRGRKIKGPSIEILLVACGAFLPWMAIDALFFDEFFLMQWFVFIAIQNYRYEIPKTPVRLDGTEDNHGRAIENQ